MSDRAEVKLTILEAVVKGYHECPFVVRVGDKFVAKQRRGDRGPALRVTDDDRSQLAIGHLQCELVTAMAADAEKVEVLVSFPLVSKRSFSDDGINLLNISPFGVIPSDIIKTVYMLYILSRSCYIYIVNESILNQLNNKDFS